MWKAFLLFMNLLGLVKYLSSYTIGTKTEHLESEENNRPIIAVLAQKVDENDVKTTSYIAASYVKFLESTGARVVPIPISYTESQVREIYGYVNGVLFPGGNTQWFQSVYWRNLKLAVDFAIQNKNFALWGTCLGFQGLNIAVAQTEKNVLGKIKLIGKVPLNFTKNAPNSRLYSGMARDLYKAIEKENVTFNHHDDGVTVQNFKNNKRLKDFFNVLSTNMDLKGDEFVSSIEAFDYPIYGTQWHPEKNNFEYNIYEDIPHSNNAVRASFHVANVFVNEARKNQNKFPTMKDEHDHMIYRYIVTDTQEIEQFKHYEQVYFFN